MSAQRMIIPPEGYAKLFAHALPGLPGARDRSLRRRREASFERFRAFGFPGPKTEEWKYTPVSSLVRRAYALPEPWPVQRSAIAPYLVADPEVQHAVFVNGRFVPELSDIRSAENGVEIRTVASALEDGMAPDLLAYSDEAEQAREREQNRGFSALNAALFGDGCLIRVSPGTAPAGPVQLLFLSIGADAPLLISPRNIVVLGEGAALDLIETHVARGSGHNLTNLVNRIVVGGGATLRHDRLQIGEVDGALIGRTEYQISADARLTQSLATLGGALVRNEIEALLDGSRIEAQLNGLYLTRAGQHIDNVIRVVHSQPGSHSDQFYKGILEGRAQAAFAGKIIVERPAQQTNAYQSNDNLLLSPDAEVNTKPELEIFADDVKCSHGATVGELDEREVFYLRSRGLDPDTARGLLTFAFAGGVLERFANRTLAAQARREVLRWLPGGAALGELG